MSVLPEDLEYTPEHVWVRRLDGRARVGITDFAQSALGEIVFVRMNGIGTVVRVGASLGELESLKSTSDVCAPLGGTIAVLNEALVTRPETVNADPYGEGWLCELEIDADDAAVLLTPAAYGATIGGEA